MQLPGELKRRVQLRVVQVSLQKTERKLQTDLQIARTESILIGHMYVMILKGPIKH